VPAILNEDPAPAPALTMHSAPVRVGSGRKWSDATAHYWVPEDAPGRVIVEALDLGGAQLPHRCLSDYLQADLSRQVKAYRAGVPLPPRGDIGRVPRSLADVAGSLRRMTGAGT